MEGVSIDERLDAAAAAANLEGPVLPPPPAIDDRSRRAALAAFAVSGATAMTLQVLWTRALAVLLGSSIFSFTLILLAFLIGLGIGAALFGRCEPADAAPGALAGPACTSGPRSPSALTYLFTDRMPYVFTWLLQSSQLRASTPSCSVSSCWPA